MQRLRDAGTPDGATFAGWKWRSNTVPGHMVVVAARRLFWVGWLCCVPAGVACCVWPSLPAGRMPGRRAPWAGGCLWSAHPTQPHLHAPQVPHLHVPTMPARPPPPLGRCRAGKSHAANELLFRAAFEEGKSLWDEEVLTEAVRALGLGDSAEAVVGSSSGGWEPELRREVLEDDVEAKSG